MDAQQDVQSKVSDVVLGKEKPVEESNPEYEKLKHYIFELEDHLAEAQKHAFRLVKRHRGSYPLTSLFAHAHTHKLVWTALFFIMFEQNISAKQAFQRSVQNNRVQKIGIYN